MIHFLRTAPTANLRGRALVRLDFNTEDTWRMEASLGTIRFLLCRADKIIIMSHRGRPRGFQKSLSLRKDIRSLEAFLKRKVHFFSHFDFAKIRSDIANAAPHSIFLLENIRFLKSEQSKSLRLARTLASLADYYVNDSFAVDHHASNSVSGVARFLPSFGGIELEKEISFLSNVLARPKKPLVFVLGGSKAADKLGIIQYFKNKADYFLLGGAAANTILFLKGINIKRSLRDRDQQSLKDVRPILKYRNIILPADVIWHDSAILDIGPKTIRNFTDVIAKARTVVWSGPLGLIEKKPYDRGTLALTRAVARNKKVFSLTGGGETVAFLKSRHLDKKFSFISTGGGAMLDFLAGKKLPGIEALKIRK